MTIRSITFPPITMSATCHCIWCGWEIYPTGWFFPDDDTRTPHREDLIRLWQDMHNGEGECRAEIVVEEVTTSRGEG